MSLHKHVDDRYIKMQAKFNSRCIECDEDLLEGDTIVYDTKERKSYCAECGGEYL